jgi:hypothetical protein
MPVSQVPITGIPFTGVPPGCSASISSLSDPDDIEMSSVPPLVAPGQTIALLLFEPGGHSLAVDRPFYQS